MVSKKTKKNTKRKNIITTKIKKVKMKDKVMFDVPHYPQTEEFTSAAACASMVLKFVSPTFKLKKENEYSIWQEGAWTARGHRRH